MLLLNRSLEEYNSYKVDKTIFEKNTSDLLFKAWII